jgi:hypothetical protein
LVVQYGTTTVKPAFILRSLENGDWDDIKHAFIGSTLEKPWPPRLTPCARKEYRQWPELTVDSVEPNDLNKSMRRKVTLVSVSLSVLFLFC